MSCARCERAIPNTAVHCPYCGHARRDRKNVQAVEGRGRDEGLEECPECRRGVEAAWLYCGACGRRVEQKLHTQSRGYSCGPAAMRNALAVLGIVEDEPLLRDLMGARAWVGTPDEGFVSAASSLGLEHRHVRDGDIALLAAETGAGHPCIVDWRHGQHYVCVIAVTDRHVVFVDSNPRDTEMVRILAHERFLAFWWDSDELDDRHHAVHIFARPHAG